MNDIYFKKVENDDYQKLIHFNEEALNLRQLGETPVKHHTDASGYTSTSRYFNIELKDRNQELRINDKGEYYIHRI